MSQEFETKVLITLARLEEKMDSSDKKHSEHFEYRNKELAPRLPVIDKLEKEMEGHKENHEKWRIGATLAILGAYIKGWVH